MSNVENREWYEPSLGFVFSNEGIAPVCHGEAGAGPKHKSVEAQYC